MLLQYMLLLSFFVKLNYGVSDMTPIIFVQGGYLS